MLRTLINKSNFRLPLSINKPLANYFFRVSRLSTSNEPNIDSKQIEKKVENVADKDGFRTIYRNFHLKGVAIINKLNPIFLKGCVIVVPPTAGILYWLGYCDQESLLGCFLFVSSFILPLQTFAFGSQRLIGFIYLNKDNDQVKIAYMTYFGKREEIILPIESIMAFSDSPVSPLDYVYSKVRTFDSNTKYKIDLRFGEVLDEEAFKLIFGDYKR